MIANGRYVRDDRPHGDRNPMSKISNVQAEIIRWSYALSTKPSAIQLKNRYKIAYNTIYQILNGYTYRCSKGPTRNNANTSPLMVSLKEMNMDERYEVYENICPKCWPQNHLKRLDCNLTTCRIQDPKICKRIFLGGEAIAIE